MPSNTRNLPFIRNYEEAEYLFGQKPAPRGKYWYEDERPLGDNRQHHYRLEKGNGYYDVCLYNTPMARYWKPEGNTRRVEYTGHGSITSSSFMWNVLHVSSLLGLETTDGRTVAVPIVPASDLATSLVLVDDKLDVEQSTHPRMFHYVSSERDKAERAEWRKKLEPWLDMMVLRMPMFEEEADMHALDGRPFAYSHASVRKQAWGTDAWAKDTVFAAQLVYNHIGSRRLYNNSDVVGYVLALPTPDEFRRSLQNTLLRKLGVMCKTGREELPMFMDWHDYPRDAHAV